MSREQSATMTDCCGARSKLAIRARENRRVWGTTQVLECASCGRRWAA